MTGSKEKRDELGEFISRQSPSHKWLYDGKLDANMLPGNSGWEFFHCDMCGLKARMKAKGPLFNCVHEIKFLDCNCGVWHSIWLAPICEDFIIKIMDG